MNTSTPRVGFGLIPGDPFWVQVCEAVQQRAEELGVALVPISVPATITSGDSHLRFLEDIKVQELGALILHVLPQSSMTAILNEGMPILCAEDTALRHPLLVSVHGLERAAMMVAEYITARLGECGRVLLVGGLDDQTPTALVRVQGFAHVLARRPDILLRHVCSTWRYAETLEQLLEEPETWAADFGGQPIDAILGLSDPLALAARDAGRRLGLVDERTLVAGINGDPLAIAAIQAGTMHATVETNPQHLGFRLAELAQRAAQHESLPEHFGYSLELVTASNVAAVAARKLLAIADLPTRLVDVNRRSEQQRLVQLEASLQLNQQVGSILDQQELLDTLAAIIGTHYDYDRVLFYLWSNNDRTLAPVQRGQAGVETAAMPLAASGVLGKALLDNQAVYIPDTQNSKRFPPEPGQAEAQARPMQSRPVQSRVVLPVHVGGRILGVLDLHSRQRTVRNQAELDALQMLADQLGTAMRNAQLYSQVVQSRAEAVQTGLIRSRQLAGVTHQMRTAINVMLGCCHGALVAAERRQDAQQADVMEDLRQAERACIDLRHLVGSLLDLAQAEIGALQLRVERIDTAAFVRDVFESAVRSFAAGRDVRWRLLAPMQLPPLVTDPVRLRTVLLNLLENAARFTERGQVILGADAEDGRLVLRVEDTGCGMAPEMVARIRQNLMLGATAAHNPALEAREPGLGLTIVSQLVERLGGELQIESEIGRGTVCCVRLALGPPAGEAVGSGGSSAPHVPVEAPLRSTYNTRQLETLVAKTREYVSNNYTAPFTREQIAAAVGVTPAYVSRVFRRQTGMALWDYVNGFRVARACDLLEHSAMSITEIAYAVGFSDPAYFSRVFRRETGKSPASYRRQAGHILATTGAAGEAVNEEASEQELQHEDETDDTRDGGENRF